MSLGMHQVMSLGMVRGAPRRKFVLQNSIPAQIRQLVIHYD